MKQEQRVIVCLEVTPFKIITVPSLGLLEIQASLQNNIKGKAPNQHFIETEIEDAAKTKKSVVWVHIQTD